MEIQKFHCVLQSRGIFSELLLKKGDNKMKYTETFVSCFSEKNFCWTLFSKKETVV